jgi:RimJ/RimL family protein N-acetyltransferase
VQTLTTERLRLARLDPDRDAASLHLMHCDRAMYDFDGDNGPTASVEATRDRLMHEFTGNGGWTWAVRLRTSDEPIGTIGLFFDQGTTIRGLSWHLRRDHWGRGIMGEAAPVVVDHLLSQPGIDGVEAWIDSRNTRSLGVARRARLDERARLPRVYADHTAQQVVMARAAEPRDPDVLGVRSPLQVRDVRATSDVLTGVLGLCVAFVTDDEPPGFARLGVAQWSGSPGIDLARAEGDIVPAAISVDIGLPTDQVYERALAAGVDVLAPPEDRPWYRRDFAFRLAEGHRVEVSGPTRPERAP